MLYIIKDYNSGDVAVFTDENICKRFLKDWKKTAIEEDYGPINQEDDYEVLVVENEEINPIFKNWNKKMNKRMNW